MPPRVLRIYEDAHTAWDARREQRRLDRITSLARRWRTFLREMDEDDLGALLVAAETEMARRRHRGETDL